jgi:structural maintenance of chromosome 2
MRSSIEQLKKDIAEAKSRHGEASEDIKRIEKDMNDFSSNKDSKLAELQSSLDALKKSQNKASVAVKTLQKDLQEARLESEQAGSDLGAAQEQLEDIERTLKAQEGEIEDLRKEQGVVKVSPRKGGGGIRHDWQPANNVLCRKLMTLPKHSWMTSEPS